MKSKSVEGASARGFAFSELSFGRADLMMLGVVLIWGAGFSIVKETVSHFSPALFNAVRSAFAVIVLLIALWSSGQRLRDTSAGWWRFILLAVVGYFGYQVLFVFGIAKTTASNSSLLLATVPVIVAALNGIFGFERVRLAVWFGVLLSFAGIFRIIIGTGANFTWSADTLLGDVLTLGAALAWAVYIVFSKPYLRAHSSLFVTTWAIGISTICLWVIALPDVPRIQWTQLPLSVWVGILYTGVLGIAVAYLLWNSALKLVGGARVAVYANLVTVVAVSSAALFLGEVITPLEILGAGAVFAGIALTHWRGAKSVAESA
ncbi:MAG TPA: DMT family transporter [Anaerolineae bacterium]|nr:DMT family transporter [Anaerolineae bacterium]